MQINAKHFLEWGRETVWMLCRLLFQVSRLDLISRCACSEVFHHMPHCVYLIDFSSVSQPKVQFVHLVCSVCFRVWCVFCSVSDCRCRRVLPTLLFPGLRWVEPRSRLPSTLLAPCNSCLCLAFVTQITATLSLRSHKAFVCLCVCVCECACCHVHVSRCLTPPQPQSQIQSPSVTWNMLQPDAMHFMFSCCRRLVAVLHSFTSTSTPCCLLSLDSCCCCCNGCCSDCQRHHHQRLPLLPLILVMAVLQHRLCSLLLLSSANVPVKYAKT